VGTRYQGITRAVYGSEACCKTVGLTAFSNTDLNRTLYLVKFSGKIPGRFVENQHFPPTGFPSPAPKQPNTPSGLTTGETILNTSSANPFPAAPPVESVKYRLSRKSKGLHPDRLSRRPGPRLDFPTPDRLPVVIDGRLRRG